MRYNHLRAVSALAGLSILGGLALTGCSSAESTASAEEPAAAASSRDDYHATVRERTNGLDGHTVYHPADLSAFPDSSVPVLAWANGGCRTSNIAVTSFLSGVAAQGYIVIANGALDELPVDQLPDDTLARPDRLTDAIDWAVDSDEAAEQLGHKADSDKIGVMGTSCGGVEALLAAADPRVKSVAGLNTGFFPNKRFGYERNALNDITVPTLLFNGGPTDQATKNSVENFDLLTVPTVLVSQETAGHSGLTYGLSGTDTSAQMMIAGYGMVADWFDYTLHNSEPAKKQFVGTDCGLCTEPGWAVQTKNL